MEQKTEIGTARKKLLEFYDDLLNGKWQGRQIEADAEEKRLFNRLMEARQTPLRRHS